jgi:hypothetical protein
MKKICIVGGRGNMATRYRCIFNMLGVEYVLWDIDEKPDLSDVDGFLVATPTPTHFDVLSALIPMKKPILCEKPVVKDLETLQQLKSLCDTYATPFACVMQYCWLCEPGLIGSSHYDYFKHGNDGLVWDTFQTIALAQGSVDVREESPIWDCVINGQRLNIAAMDFAYIEMIKSWLRDPASQPWDFILKSHEKVLNYAKEHPHSNPG